MEIDRRSFMERMGKGVLVLSILSFIGCVRGLQRKDLETGPDHDRAIIGLSREERDILYLASLAPSGHNTQPWTIRVIEPQHWIVGVAKERRLPAVDPENRELLLSLGAFVENLDAAAGAYGYNAVIDVLAKDPLDCRILDIQLAKKKPVEFDVGRIKRRRTLRTLYLKKALDAADLRHMTELFEGRCHYFTRGSRQGAYLQEGTIEANRIQVNREPAMEELANWIRWSGRDARQYRNGLTPEALDIHGMAGWFVRHFFNRESVLKPGFRRETVNKVVEQTDNCGGWLVVTSDDSSIPSLIETGKRFEKMFLKIREKGIALHPMTQMLEELPMKNQVAGELGLNGPIQFILRVGYVNNYPDPVSLRMPPSWFVTSGEKAESGR